MSLPRHRLSHGGFDTRVALLLVQEDEAFRSHSLVAIRHLGDERIPADVKKQQETEMFSIPVQRRRSKTPGGKDAQSTDEKPSNDRS
jgi:hypothetical protein